WAIEVGATLICIGLLVLLGLTHKSYGCFRSLSNRGSSSNPIIWQIVRCELRHMSDNLSVGQPRQQVHKAVSRIVDESRYSRVAFNVRISASPTNNAGRIARWPRPSRNA